MRHGGRERREIDMTGPTVSPAITVPPSPIVYQSGVFPSPRIVPFADLGLPGRMESLFVDASRGLQDTFKYRPSEGMVHSLVAFRLGRIMHFGDVCKSNDWIRTWTTVNDHFFGGIDFFLRGGEVRPVEIQLNADDPFPDGGTAKIVRWAGSGDADIDAQMGHKGHKVDPVTFVTV